jgi:hypothetical protein
MSKSPKPRTATCKSGLQVRQEGYRQVRRTVRHCSLGELGQVTKRLMKKGGRNAS